MLGVAPRAGSTRNCDRVATVILVPHPGGIAKQIGLDQESRALERRHSGAAQFDGDTGTAVAGQRRRIIAAPDGVIADGEFLETEQGVEADLRAWRDRHRQRVRQSEFAISIDPHQRPRCAAIGPARRRIALVAAFLGRAENVEALAELEPAADLPFRAPRLEVDRVEIGANERHPQTVAGQRADEVDLLIDVIKPAAERQIMRLRPDHRITQPKCREQSPRLDIGVARVAVDRRLGPGVGELPADRQPFAARTEAVPDLDDLLFLEIER